MRKILFTMFFGASSLLYAQNEKVSHTYKWETETIPSISIDPDFKNEGAVALNEETIISFVTNTVKKHLIIKYQNQQGIQQHHTFDLPESFDYLRDSHVAKTTQNKPLHCPKIYDDGIKYFAARIQKTNGTIVSAVFKDSTELETIVLKGLNKAYYAYFFSIENIEPGDVVEIVYESEMPFSYYKAKRNETVGTYIQTFDYDINVPVFARIFLNGVLPKQLYSLNVHYPSQRLYSISCFNGGRYTDSTDVNGITKYNWQLHNLKGGINEEGARPYETLPFIQIYFNYRDFVANTSTGRYAREYTWTYIGYKMFDFKLSPIEYSRRMTSGNFHAVDEFITNSLAGLNDSTIGILRFQKLHEAVNEKLKYCNDEEYYSGRDNGLENMDKYLRKNQTLRDLSRFHIYKMLADYTVPNYNLCGIADNRIEGGIDPGKFKPYFAFNWYYHIPFNNGGIYLTPKKHQFGLHVNELPFYLENVMNICIPQSIPLEDRRGFKFDIKYTKTPINTISDNVRKTNVLVNISTTSGAATFDAKISLAGQFSTMCRGYYKCGFIDSTSNKKYASMVSDITAAHTLLDKSLVNENINFPFDTDFRVKYESQSAVKYQADGREIDLGNWFNHVVPDHFNTTNRQLTYYSDFLGMDTYRYNLVFDQKVEVLNKAELEKDLENTYGVYKFHITQPQPNIIVLESYYVVKSESVPAAQIQEVGSLYQAIYANNGSKLKFKVIQ